MRATILIGLVGLVLFACDAGLPDLSLERKQDSVTVHLETLGEYPTSVGRLLLKDAASGRTIWEVQRSAGTPQLWKVDFRIGENPSQPEGVTGGGSLDVLIPRQSSSFVLEGGREYALTVWSSAERSSRTTRFEIGTDSEPVVDPEPS